MRRREFSSRNCIFCGQKPQSKSREHFIARWLSRFAGNDELAADIIDADGSIVSRRWSSLILPACTECNARYGEFEEFSKPALERLSQGYLRSKDAQVLLDYMDKLRVSIWLWRLYWSKKYHSISPNYYVDERVGSSDRVILIGMYPDDEVTGIAPIGYDSMAFLRCPTVFGVFIRNFFILSASSAALLTDHFSMTSRGAPKDRLLEGQVGRLITNMVVYRPLSRLFRLSGLKFFSFGSQADIFAPLSNHVYFDTDGGARIVRACEEFALPKISQNAEKAKILAQLNVHELQLQTIAEYNLMNISQSDQLTTQRCEEELKARIRGDLLMLQATSPLIFPSSFSGFRV